MSPFQLADLQLIGPVVAVFVFALLVLIFDVSVKPFNRTTSLWVSLLGLVVAAVLEYWLLDVSAHPAFEGMIAVDGYASFAHLVVLMAAAGALGMGHRYLSRVGVEVPEYHPLVLLAAFGMMLMASGNDLIMLFIAVEVMSISVYVLAAINRGEWRGVEGAIKYFVLGAFSSAILLYGIALVYGVTGTTRLDWIASWMHEAQGLRDNPMLAVGLVLMLVGFGFKISAVPFHMWAPDVYEGAPTPMTAFMATGVKAAAVAALGRVLFVAFLSGKAEWGVAIWALCALTMLGGNIVALVQTDFKRMLAYSSIAHAGYLLMAVVAAPGTSLADNPRIGGMLFYLFTYTIMNVGAFAAVSLLVKDGADDARIERLNGLASKHPALALGLTVCLLSLAGIPPMMGFVGKFYLFAAAIDGGYYALAGIGALASAIGVYYYLRPVVLMYMRPPVSEDALEVDPDRAAMSTLAVAAVALVVLGVLPGPLVDWARNSVLSLVHWAA